MKNQLRAKLSLLLNELEQALVISKLWQKELPSEEMLASTQPFALDRLSAPQWLQWIFIAKMREILARGYPLPAALEISPYLEQALPANGKENIIAICMKIDELFIGNLDA